QGNRTHPDEASLPSRRSSDLERGEGIVATALTLHHPVDISRGELVRALEEHVLLEMRVAEAVGPLVAHPGGDPEIDGHDVGRAVVLHDEGEAVRQNLEDGRGRLTRRRGGAATRRGTP